MRVPCSDPRAVRIQHVQGERLRAADLRDALGVESWMRQLHMIGQHDTWGIALGLAVELQGDPQRGVRVGAGLAYDALGRPLPLPTPRDAPNPWSSHPGADPRAAFDLALIADAERDRPALIWRPSAQVRLGIEVPLIRARRADPEAPVNPGDPPPPLALDGSARWFAETQARPHVAAATTPPDQVWEPWAPEGEEGVWGRRAVVDIGGWGFASAPTVLASLVLELEDAGAGADQLLIEFARFNRFYLTRVHLDWDRWPGRFEFIIMPSPPSAPMPAEAPAIESHIVVNAYRSPFRIAWVGVEPAVGCPLREGETLGPIIPCREAEGTSPEIRPTTSRRSP